MSKIFPLVTVPETALHKKAVPVTREEIATRVFQDFLDNMFLTMHQANGIGLAAVQIGDPRSIAVIDTKEGGLVLINPKIIKLGWRKKLMEEGCLSVPGVWSLVKRSQYVRCEALDRHGKTQDIQAKGLLAQVIQHETDHLIGILNIDRAKKIIKPA